MCLAIPMKVIELREDGFFSPVALVDADGFHKEVRLDLVDRMPVPGEFLIVHAGYAIRTLTQEEAMENLSLMKEMARGLERGAQ